MEHFHYTLSELETLGDSLPELKAMGMLNAKRGMVNIFGDTLSEVEIDTLVDTLVERKARMEVKSLKNTLEKKAKQQLLDT